MREFRQTQGRAGERYWIIDIKGEKVLSSWGAVKDGKHKEHNKTADIPGPKGKEGTKAYVDAKANAKFEYERAIRKKTEEGYVEVGLDGRPLIGGSADEIDHSAALPKNLCFSKPKNGVSEKHMMKLDAAKQSIYTRKINGMMVIAHIRGDRTVELYSRRMDRLTYHFPHLVRALSPGGLPIPSNSILLFEAFMAEGNSKRDLLLCQSVMRSKMDRAHEQQEKLGWMKFYLFRVPILDGEHLEAKYNNEANILTIENAFTDMFIEYRDHPNSPVKGQFLFALEIMNTNMINALEMAKESGWEGWVVYEKDATLGDKSYSFHGKPDRPSSCFKLKPAQEDDFIAFFDPDKGTKGRPMGTWGTGKNMGRVGTLSLYQLDPAGKEVYVCEVGSGLSDEQRRKMANGQRWPIVAQIEFEERFFRSAGDGSNALHLPRVVGIREDKDPAECICEELGS
jgi:predicted DNA-binding WGR domain protein